MVRHCFRNSEEAATFPCYSCEARFLSASVFAGAILEVYGWHSDSVVPRAVVKYAEYSHWLPGEENVQIKLC